MFALTVTFMVYMDVDFMVTQLRAIVAIALKREDNCYDYSNKESLETKKHKIDW